MPNLRLRPSVIRTSIAAAVTWMAMAVPTTIAAVPPADLEPPRSDVARGFIAFVEDLRRGRIAAAVERVHLPRSTGSATDDREQLTLQLRDLGNLTRAGAWRPQPLLEWSDVESGTAVLGVLLDDEGRTAAEAILDGKDRLRPQIMIRGEDGQWRVAISAPETLGLEPWRLEELEDLVEQAERAIPRAEDDLRHAARAVTAGRLEEFAATMPTMLRRILGPDWEVQPGLVMGDLRAIAPNAGPLEDSISDLRSRGLFGFASAGVVPPAGSPAFDVVIGVFSSTESADRSIERMISGSESDDTRRRPDLGDPRLQSVFGALDGQAFVDPRGRVHTGRAGTWLVEVREDRPERTAAAARLHDAILRALPSIEAMDWTAGDLSPAGYLGPMARLAIGFERPQPPEPGDTTDIDIDGETPWTCTVTLVSEEDDGGEAHEIERVAGLRRTGTIRLLLQDDSEPPREVHLEVARYPSAEDAFTSIGPIATRPGGVEGMTRREHRGGVVTWSGPAPNLGPATNVHAGTFTVALVGVNGTPRATVDLVRDLVLERMSPSWTGITE